MSCFAKNDHNPAHLLYFPILEYEKGKKSRCQIINKNVHKNDLACKFSDKKNSFEFWAE